jgi:hypothetical protein
MAKAKESSPLVSAAAALDKELHALAELASETKRESLNTERSIARATTALSDSVQFQARIEGKLKGLVSEIAAIQKLQQDSIDTLVTVAREVERRAKSRDELLRRFAELGAMAAQVNTLARELTTREAEGSAADERLDRLRVIEQQMDAVVAEAQSIAEAAARDDWPEFARQADSARQQMLAARNKLVLAHKGAAERAPS